MLSEISALNSVSISKIKCAWELDLGEPLVQIQISQNQSKKKIQSAKDER